MLALHSPNNLILWNTESGTKIWTKNFSESILQITIDPFLNRRIALLSSSYIQFIEDFSCTQQPQNQPRRFHITNANSTSDDRRASQVSSGSSSIFAASYWLKTIVENASDVKQQQQNR